MTRLKARPASKRTMILSDPREARRIIRTGDYDGHTAGIAPDYVQGNLCILPKDMATEFAAFCQRNPKPCPMIGMGAPGDPTLPDLGDIDIRTDVPRYRVFKDGKLVDEPTDIRNYWTDDLVTFVLGCSFSFEQADSEEGIRLQHMERNTTVPMYRTNIDCVPAGRFKGKMVVSMRPFVPADAIRAVQITSRFPAVHGAPVHIGLPEAIGIADLAHPDLGDPPRSATGELPVFWACGVTPQVAVEAARPSICITHKPGAMLITDRRNARWPPSSGYGVGPSAADEHRHRAVRQHVDCLAANQNPGDAAPAVRCHHDQVATLGLRRVDDGVGRIVHHVHRLAGNSGGLRDGAHRVQNVGCVLSRRSLVFHDWEGGARVAHHHGRPGLAGGDGGQLGAEPFGQFDAAGHGLGRKLGSIGGDQDMLVHG